MSAAGGFGQGCVSGQIYAFDFGTDPTGVFFDVQGGWSWVNGQYESDASEDTKTWIEVRPQWKNYVVEARITLVTAPEAADNAGILFRIVDIGTTASGSGKMYYFGISTGGTVAGRYDGSWNPIASGQPTSYQIGKSYLLSVNVSGTFMAFSVDGNGTASFSDPNFSYGSIGLHTYKAIASFDDVKVTCMP